MVSFEILLFAMSLSNWERRVKNEALFAAEQIRFQADYLDFQHVVISGAVLISSSVVSATI